MQHSSNDSTVYVHSCDAYSRVLLVTTAKNLSVFGMSPYSFRMRGNIDQNNSEYGTFQAGKLFSDMFSVYLRVTLTEMYITNEN